MRISNNNAGLALTLVTMAALALQVQSSDPELTTDFFVPEGVNKDNLTGDFFTDVTLSKIRPVFASGAKFSIKRVNSSSFPALTGLGISCALVGYLPGGINPPHLHPRGTELLLVEQGVLTVGLIDSSNKFYTQTLKKGDLFVFPKGLVHYQINLGDKEAIGYSAFSSSNPGTISLPANLFGSTIPSIVLETAFKVSGSVIDELEAPFAVK